MINSIEKVSKIYKILRHPKGGLKYLFKENPISISSFQIVEKLKHYIPELNTIVDVGANIGQFTIASSLFYPKAKIFSFEPVKESFRILKKNTKQKKNVTIHNCALGSTDGMLEFYHNEHSHASSALTISEFQTTQIPQTQKFNKIEVPVHKLDKFEFKQQIDSPILLKLDVQGYEKKVLEGGLIFLQHVEYLLFETSFISMYDNEPLFDEMHEFVTQHGFEVVAPIGILEANNQIIQLDMLYQRKSS